jgi:hypothetical protein
MVVSPVGLDEDAVDLFEVHGLGLVFDGFQETGEGEISGPSDDALGGTDYKSYRFLGEGVVTEAGLVEFGEDPCLHVVGSDLLHDDRIGYSALDVLVVGQADAAQERRLADQDEVMVLGEVLEEQAELSEALDIHEMSVVNDRRDHLAQMVQSESLLDQALFAAEGAALEIDAEGGGEDFNGVEIGVKSSRYGWRDKPFLIEGFERFLQDGLAGAGFAEHEAESALLAMDSQGIENDLLVRQERDVLGCERILGKAEVGSDHDRFPFY